MTTPARTETSPRRRATSWRAALTPNAVTGWVRGMALASVLANLLLVLTGGLVRLTQSGLGCPTWPRCTSDSWTNVPAMGIHGFIEFGNRTLTGVLTIVAVLTWLAVVRLRQEYRDLFGLATLLLLGIPVQAVVGGVSVHLGLNPWVVGVHFILSALMIGLAAALWNRTRRYSLPDVREAERLAELDEADPVLARAGWLLLALIVVALYLGTLVTGTGPHSGDATSARHAFNALVVTRMHAASVWLTIAVLAATWVLARRRGWAPAVRRSIVLAVGVVILQGLIGYLQYFNGLPIWMVELHLIGAGLTSWAFSSLYERASTLGIASRRETALAKVDSAQSVAPHGTPVSRPAR